MPDATASLHREGSFLDGIKNGAQIILDPSHHKAVEKGYAALRARTGKNTPTRDKFPLGYRVKKFVRPETTITRRFRQSDGLSDPRRRVGKGLVYGRARNVLKSIFHIPDFPRNGGPI